MGRNEKRRVSNRRPGAHIRPEDQKHMVELLKGWSVIFGLVAAVGQACGPGGMDGLRWQLTSRKGHIGRGPDESLRA